MVTSADIDGSLQQMVLIDRNVAVRPRGDLACSREGCYFGTLQTVASERTRIEREFDAAAIKRLKESARSDIYAWAIGVRRQRRRTRIALAAQPYPKQRDD